MYVSIEFNTDNAAFADDPDEVGRILRALANQIDPDNSGVVVDINGNAVGEWSWE